MIFLPRSEWTERYLRDCLTEHVDVCGQAFCEGVLTVEAASPKKNRSVNGTANVEQISRSGICVEIAGGDLRHFKANPVVLANHYSAVPMTLMPAVIALVGSITKQDGKLVFKNMTFDTDPLAEAWFQKICRRLVRMVSIGFLPTEVEYVEERKGRGPDAATIRYLRIAQWEMVELSITPIGANRGAFIDPTTVPSGGEGVPPHVLSRLDALATEVAELRSTIDGTDPDGEAFGDASFPDAAFIVEKGAPKEDGRTPQKYRHLPHHRKNVKSAAENGSVDLPHLRNALARVNQVKPVEESAESYRRRAETHLRAHAKVLLKSKSETLAALTDLECLLAPRPDGGRALELASKFQPTR